MPVEALMLGLEHPTQLVGPCMLRCVAERSEEHTSELQSRPHIVCRLLLEKKNNSTPALMTVGPLRGAVLSLAAPAVAMMACFFFLSHVDSRCLQSLLTRRASDPLWCVAE